MTFQEWVELYNAKAPEPFARDERYTLLFLPEKGFCEVGMTEDMVIIRQLSGDGRFWYDKITDMARKLGAKQCGTWCIRQAILAYIRLFGYRIEKVEKLPDGLKRYYGIRKTDGKKGLASPCFKYLGGEQAYFITWEP